jgi:peroxiredoxin
LKDVQGNPLDHAFIERTTFVIGKNDKIVATLSSADDKITPADHVDKSLAVVSELTGKGK